MIKSLWLSSAFSVNNMRASVNGRLITTKEYREWQAQAHRDLENQEGIGTHDGFFRTDFLIPGHYRGDIDNYNKAILDALDAAGKIPNDRRNCDCRIRFHDGPKVQIAIKREELEKWAKIRQLSQQLTRKLAKSGTQKQLPL